VVYLIGNSPVLGGKGINNSEMKRAITQSRINEVEYSLAGSPGPFKIA